MFCSYVEVISKKKLVELGKNRGREILRTLFESDRGGFKGRGGLDGSSLWNSTTSTTKGPAFFFYFFTASNFGRTILKRL